MAKKCPHCGHDPRRCRGFKLFGGHIDLSSSAADATNKNVSTPSSSSTVVGDSLVEEEIAKRCPHCGHDPRTCRGLKLIGSHIDLSSTTADATKKNVSTSSSSLSSSPENLDKPADGYLPDGPFAGVKERKTWTRWTEEEHRSFLVGLERLGSRWKKISIQYVTTRTPAEVSSHAQRYFRRQAALDKKRRSKLFDTVEGSQTKQSGDPAQSENPESD